MDGSGCSELFPDSELQRFLKPESFALLERIRQEKELALANLANLEECPFCNFALIIEDPNERLFECQKEDCGKVSCRQCKKENHLPKTCKEMDQDAKLNQLHNVAEKMTEALLRKCPGRLLSLMSISSLLLDVLQQVASSHSSKSMVVWVTLFLDRGSTLISGPRQNKMTCPACNTLSCFCCGKKIKGYAHFRDGGRSRAWRESLSHCIPVRQLETRSLPRLVQQNQVLAAYYMTILRRD